MNVHRRNIVKFNHAKSRNPFSPESERWRVNRTVLEKETDDIVNRIPPETLIQIAEMGSNLDGTAGRRNQIHEENPVSLTEAAKATGTVALALGTIGMAAAQPDDAPAKYTPYDATLLADSLIGQGIPPICLANVPGGIQILNAHQASVNSALQKCLIIYQAKQNAKNETTQEGASEKARSLSKSEIKKELSPRNYTKEKTEGYSDLPVWAKPEYPKGDWKSFVDGIGFNKDDQELECDKPFDTEWGTGRGGEKLKHPYVLAGLGTQEDMLKNLSRALDELEVPNQIVVDIKGGNHATVVYSDGDYYNLVSQKKTITGISLEYEIYGEMKRIVAANNHKFEYVNINSFTSGDRKNTKGYAERVVEYSNFGEYTRKTFPDII